MDPCRGTAPTVVYDPAHTFFKFDLLVSQLRPFHVQLQYCGGDCRDLDVDVNPTAVGSFQTWVVPISAFTPTIYLFGHTGIPAFPTVVEFGIHGEVANSATTWPAAPDNVFMVDNIAYIIAPPLSIAPVSDGLVLSWSTNTTGFVLKQSSDLGGTNWTSVTNAPVVNNGCNQVTLPAAAGQGFYRLEYAE
jgi:hypothetical protein